MKKQHQRKSNPVADQTSEKELSKANAAALNQLGMKVNVEQPDGTRLPDTIRTLPYERSPGLWLVRLDASGENDCAIVSPWEDAV